MLILIWVELNDALSIRINDVDEVVVEHQKSELVKVLSLSRLILFYRSQAI